MKLISLFLCFIFLAGCVATPSALSTAAAVAAKPSQESLQSYFDLSAATDSNGASVSMDDNEGFRSSINSCASEAIAQYDQDVLSEVAEDATSDLAAQAAGQAAMATGAGSVVGGALLAPVAVFAAPAALAYSAYSAVNTAAEIAVRFEAEKDYALQMQQCVGQAGFTINLIDFEDSEA